MFCRFTRWTAVLLLVISLLLPIPVSASVQKDGVHITVLHTNDMHSRILPSDERDTSIGISWIAAAIWQQKENDEDTIALDAGDTLHGMPIINISKGENMVRLLNLAGYDAMTPGNHDFNYGSHRLVELAAMMNFPVLTANVVDKDQQQYLFRPYKSFTCSGVRIAVFGLSTPEIMFKTNPANVTEVQILDPIAEAKKLVPKLRETHDVVIGLMHMGLDASSEVTSERIAQEVPGIDLIIDAHSHTQLDKGLQVGKTLICQTGCYDRMLGKVELVVKDHKLSKVKSELISKPQLQKMVKKTDPGVSQAIEVIQKNNKAAFDKVVTESPKTLTSRREIVRAQESELGNLAADATRWGGQADIGLVNGGNLRADLPQGKVTQGDLLNIFPFGNTIKRVELSGAAVKQLLEHSVEYVPAAFGGFMDVSGVTFDLDPSAPAGSRVSNVLVGGQPLNEQHMYQLAVNDFIAAGGDGYDMFKTAKVTGEFGTMEEIFASYLNQHGMGSVETGRIQVKH